MKRFLSVLAVALAIAAAACHHLDDERVPLLRVWLSFNFQADWTRYGTPAAGDYRLFVKSTLTPSDYPYTALESTGFGGVLLVCDVMGNPKAFCAACPVEVKQDVLVFINDDNHAECPRCHSIFDVFSLDGVPIAGRAADEGWSLRRYSVGPGDRGEYMLVR
ncbi:MAG: hypothetical protein K2L21_00390 [Muribaculaceae bacterium]|nr:hypothetical protein [Muribaculaceae bacterium]